MLSEASFDVLVVGSGASGLAAAVSAERAGARVALATKTTLQACNSAKAQGGIQAAFGEDDSPEIHAEDVMRSSHETADRRLVDVLTGEAPSAIHWLEENGVEFTRQGSNGSNGRCHSINRGYRLARCGGATRQRLLQVGDRTGHAITKALREGYEAGGGVVLPHHALRSLAPTENGWRATFDTKEGSADVDAAAVVLAAGGRCYLEAEQRGELSTNHPNATGEVTRIALEAGRRGARPRRAPVPPERRRLAVDDAGLLDPGDHARVRRRPAERGRRGVHGLARRARRGLAGDLRRGREGQGRVDARRATCRVARHDQDLGGGRGDLAAVHAAPLPRRRASIRSRSRSSRTPSSTTRTAAS